MPRLTSIATAIHDSRSFGRPPPERRESGEALSDGLDAQLSTPQSHTVSSKCAEGFLVRFVRQRLFLSPEVILEAPDGFSFYSVDSCGRIKPFYNVRDADIS